MYTNIGGKIKLLAKVWAWLGIIASVGSAIAQLVMINRAPFNNIADQGISLMSILTAVGIVIAGTLISWVSSWALYGFGELIAKASEIAENTRKLAADAHRP
jgi:hypothetical protein